MPLLSRLFLTLALLGLSGLAAARAEAASFTTRNYAPSLTGQVGFAQSSFGFGFGISRYDMPAYHDRTEDNTRIDIYRFDLAGSYAILPNKLSIGADLSMQIIAGDRSDFAFGHFGLSSTYTFYNQAPVFVSAGLGLKLLNQSLSSTFSPDVFYMRPFIVAGVNVWRVYITPYLGIPVYIDTNNDNDLPDTFCTRGAGHCYPERHPNYWQDDNPFGVDYGVPVAFGITNSFFLTVEPSGMTWLYPDHITTLWVTPGVMYRATPIILGAGVKFRVYTTNENANEDDFWQVVFTASLVF